MIGSGLGEQTSNGYLHRGMIRNALACYDLAGWLHDLLAAFFIPVLLWAVGHFLGTVLKGRPRGLKLLWLLSVLVFLAALNFIFSRYGWMDEFNPPALTFWVLVALVAFVGFYRALSSAEAGDRGSGWRAFGAVAVGVAALMLPALTGWVNLNRGKVARGPNVLLVSVDTLRADHLSCYGYHKKLTPNIDEFAKESVVFTSAIASSPWTLPSHVSMLTGHVSSSVGVRTDKQKIPARVDTLAERLRERGYLTASFNEGGFVRKAFGFAQGFDTYWSSPTGDSPSPDVIKTTNEKTLEYLKSIDGKRFFLFYHTYQVHHRYWPHEGFSEPEAWRCEYGLFGWPQPTSECHVAYEGEIAYMDHYIGELFDFLREHGLYDDMLIIFTSDHGEVFIDDQRGMIGHGYLLYDELIRVPLIIKFPRGMYGGRVIDAQVRLVDIVPTVLDALQIDGFAGRGDSLLPLIRGARATSLEAISEFYPFPNPKIYFHFPELNTRKVSLRRPGAKLIVDYAKLSSELYDLEADPKEKANLLDGAVADAYPRGMEMFAALIRALEQGALAYTGAGGGEKAEMTPELHEQLKALGYVQ